MTTLSPSARPSIRTLPRRLWGRFWPYVAISALLFALGTVAGGLLAGAVDLAALFGSPEGLEGAFPEPTVSGLLVNNAVVLVLLVLSGLSLGLVTVAILVFNGFIVGYIGALAAGEGGLGVLAVGILPHGVFEIPAILFAAAVAFRFSHQVLAAALGRRSDVMTTRERREALALVVVSLLLLPIAAYIEVNVTATLLERYAGG